MCHYYRNYYIIILLRDIVIVAIIIIIQKLYSQHAPSTVLTPPPPNHSVREYNQLQTVLLIKNEIYHKYFHLTFLLDIKPFNILVSCVVFEIANKIFKI